MASLPQAVEALQVQVALVAEVATEVEVASLVASAAVVDMAEATVVAMAAATVVVVVSEVLPLLPWPHLAHSYTSATSPSRLAGKSSRTFSELLATLSVLTSTWDPTVDHEGLVSSSLLPQKTRRTLFKCTTALTGTAESSKCERTALQAVATEAAAALVVVGATEVATAAEAMEEAMAVVAVASVAVAATVVALEAAVATVVLALAELLAAMLLPSSNCLLPIPRCRFSSRT